MSQTERIYRLRALLLGPRASSMPMLVSELGVSLATIKRDIAYLRDRLQMPVVFDRDAGGYRIEARTPSPVSTPTVATRTVNGMDAAARHELPGLWLSADEVVALLTIQHMLSTLEPSLIGERLRPLHNRLLSLLAMQGLSEDDLRDRVRIVHAGKRQLPPAAFACVARATFARKRLQILHYNRQTDASVSRVVSPQRLVHYRDNWYVDAWCHLRRDLRAFAIDAIIEATELDADAQELDPDYVTRVNASSYGIFAGEPQAWAQLRFTTVRSRWVRRQQWHPEQRMEIDAAGRVTLEVPYSDPRELIAAVLSYGADVEVLAPASLRQIYAEVVAAMAARCATREP